MNGGKIAVDSLIKFSLGIKKHEESQCSEDVDTGNHCENVAPIILRSIQNKTCEPHAKCAHWIE